jgi:DNA repair protein RecN (Recombination protein N)
MLAYLHVKNIALIEELDIDFNEGLNILTGETGAGKSIILGSIHYVLGAKIKKDFIRTGAKEAFVECVFDIRRLGPEKQEIHRILKENGVADDDESIIMNRKTAQNGRSVFRVNGEVVRQEVIRRLAAYLIDIHSQHEHQSLLSSKKQLQMLDRYIGEELLSIQGQFSDAYKLYRHLLDSINEDLYDDEKRRREIAFLEFEIDEIVKAELTLGEDEENQKIFDRLSHRNKIITVLSNMEGTFYDQPDFSSIVSKYIGELNRVLTYDEELSNFIESLVQVEDILNIIHHDLSNYLDDEESYEEELHNAEERLNTINSLKLKYGDTIEDILTYKNKKEEELARLVHFEENLLKTKKRLKELEEEMKIFAGKLTAIRKKGALKLGANITKALKALNLEHAEFGISVEALDNYTPSGRDHIVFMISTNKGEQKKPLSDVASGGELSRVMLAIKSILSSVDGVDTLVFDEIDSGISGITAQKVAERMKTLSKERQLICITHLPQIAAMSDCHFLIHKETMSDFTVTMMKELNHEESVQELARMLSGAKTTEITVANAIEMKAHATKM